MSIRYDESLSRSAVLELGAIVIRANSTPAGARWFAFAHYASDSACRTIADGGGASAEESIGEVIASLSKLHAEIERAIRLAANPDSLLDTKAGQ